MENLQAIFDEQLANRWKVSQSTASERKEKLLALKKAIMDRREEIQAAMHADFKKPYAESELTEIHTVLEEINYAVKRLSKWMKPKKVKSPITLFGSKSYIRYEAKGVVLVLAPWNYPVYLFLSPMIAALAAGNCIISRPSDKTPHTAKVLKSILESVYQPNEVKVLTGEHGLAEKLLELPFDHIFFTGSIEVGKKVMAAASKNLTPVTLELGGKSPVIIDREVDLEACVEKVIWAKFINGGQTCVAPDYLFIAEDLKDKFVELAKIQIEKNFGATSSERLKTEDFARMVDLKAYDRLAGILESEKPLMSDKPSRDERYIPATILPEAKLTGAAMKEEIFGPILPVITYKKLDEAITYIQNHHKPLAFYIFSNNKKTVKYILENTTSGGAVINHLIIHLSNSNLPFGGVGHSGMGNYHGEYGFKTFSHERAVLNQGSLTLTKFYFPPYNTSWSKFAFRILRWLE